MISTWCLNGLPGLFEQFLHCRALCSSGARARNSQAQTQSVLNCNLSIVFCTARFKEGGNMYVEKCPLGARAEKSCSIKEEKISWLIKFLSLPLRPRAAAGALRRCMPKIWHKDDAPPPAIYARLLYYCLYLALLYKIHRSIKSYIICCKSWFARCPANRLRVSMQRYFMAP